ncbi:tRNA-uridine aminocarboxypropyltransferase [Mariniblastus fucicola]|uniref:tRNA-uridine aminocarboxypropyltransferase n=1 Tax=Mariniblastus fucicola TaxID=980251 RepID=A0A5B9P8U7_9BACT|nr:tRNA-uridine aminocarboxypropyltransferase [Mariniblastus fucicola]QEG23157.1 DTW domain protein [Mariniblastus fucicola]
MNRSSKIQQRIRTLPEGEFRERCYGCYRPVQHCFCAAIPRVDNQTDVLILQHQRERSHPFNTARIVNQALVRCKLLFDRNETFAARDLPIGDGAALLYPGKGSRLLDELSEEELPKQLVIIDGTWDQAKTLFRDVPQLHQLPQVKLAPSTPGQYRIRLEPTDTSLSTLEATVQSLQQLEPHTTGLDELSQAFNTMVEQQLAHPNASYGDGSPRPKMETPNIPSSFRRDPSQIVVAYAEATPVDYQAGMPWTELNRLKKLAAKEPPVYCIAQRMSENQGPADSFCQTITPAKPISQANLDHMGLSQSDFESQVSVPTFCERWNHFLRPDDLLIVPNQKTIRLLARTGVQVPDYELLKAINFDPRNEFPDLTEFLNANDCSTFAARHQGRAGKRLASAVALVHHFRSVLADNNSQTRQ